ncbi:MAG: SUMF1/EgtB/PvdO family nonheme iron enzyme [Deltaproteobacteria bacterium]|nr:SUMF1/EgtB/PvdO family nonheme iron enzyme [Deltaproteobacteria bacterium]
MSDKVCIDRLGRGEEAWSFIPAGPFKMGSEDGGSDERPVRQVTLDAYCPAKYEISNDDWARYKAATSSSSQRKFELVHIDCSSQSNEKVVDTRATREELAVSPANVLADHKNVCGVRSREVLPPIQDEDERPSPEGFDAPNQPRVNISRQEARGYCQWLGGDLMTEAQWEKAAKGGKDLEYATADGKISKGQANYSWFFGKTVVVGSYAANPFGLHDMAGNVWEWVKDNYDASAYTYLSAENPVNLKETGWGVLRGGGWYYLLSDSDLRAANRRYYAPAGRDFDIGARCALSPRDLNQ